MKSTYCEYILENILSTSEVWPILALIAPSSLISVVLLAFCDRCKIENKISPNAHTNELYIHHIVRTLYISLHRSLLHITNHDCSTSN
jgi:hypothetical protein